MLDCIAPCRLRVIQDYVKPRRTRIRIFIRCALPNLSQNAPDIAAALDDTAISLTVGLPLKLGPKVFI